MNNIVDRKKIAVKLKKVTKNYKLHNKKPTFVEQLIKINNKEQFTALNNVNLTIFKGEKIGIIGANGSGKTTVLKIISKITTPSNGFVYTNGKVVSLIDLTAGFHPDLTGMENIYLNGLVIGMSKENIKSRLNEIIKFADIGDFINNSLYTYSEGMKLRLGFSIAIYSNPDILIIDEGIVTGDNNFQKKSGDKIEEFFEANKTIIIVTHWIEYLEQHCNRFLLMKNGKMIKSGGKEIIDYYKKNSNI